MGKKSKKEIEKKSGVSMNPGKMAAYSVYATGACASVALGSTLALDNVKMSRKEKKQVRKIRDTATMLTIAGSMGTMVYTTFATAKACSSIDMSRYEALVGKD